MNQIGRKSIRAKLAAKIGNGESVIAENMPYPLACKITYIHDM